ncbi:MAG: hypothetical protein Q6365_016445 [Candidatus Sigynarchaeota archaeon]
MMSKCGIVDLTRIGRLTEVEKAISEIGYAMEILGMLKNTLKQPALDMEDERDIKDMFHHALAAVYQAEHLVVKDKSR